MPTQTEAEREARASALADKDAQEQIRDAEARGRREQLVDSRLDHHEARLDAINGSVARAARASESLGEKVDELASKIGKSEAVNEALAQAAKDAISASISRKDFLVGVALVAIMLLGVIVTIVVAALA